MAAPVEKRKHPDEWRYIRLDELSDWEAKGWFFLAYYKMASDDIHSILIGKYDDPA